MAYRWKIHDRRLRHVVAVFALACIIAGWSLWQDHQARQSIPQPTQQQIQSGNLASASLAMLPIKGRAPKTGYDREQFGAGWANTGGCNMRERILARDMHDVQLRSSSDCTVLSGTLDDPYTGQTIHFVRGPDTSGAVQIDHVVALGDAWQKGAQQLTKTMREQLYNDPLELLAVDGDANQQKSDGDAATWLPHNKSYRCRYVARQIAVKAKYHLWVTQAEHDAMTRVLDTCPTQELPKANG
jgi:hypothetical protein